MSHSQPKKIEKRAQKIGDPGDPQHYAKYKFFFFYSLF
jgi:hypothetical protein